MNKILTFIKKYGIVMTLIFGSSACMFTLKFSNDDVQLSMEVNCNEAQTCEKNP